MRNDLELPEVAMNTDNLHVFYIYTHNWRVKFTTLGKRTKFATQQGWLFHGEAVLALCGFRLGNQANFLAGLDGQGSLSGGEATATHGTHQAFDASDELEAMLRFLHIVQMVNKYQSKRLDVLVSLVYSFTKAPNNSGSLFLMTFS